MEQVLQQRLAPARLQPYTAAAGSPRAGIRLYQWNVEVSGALYEALHVIEVVLRNALHEQLSQLQLKRHGGGSWLDSPFPELTDRARSDIDQARRRAQEEIARKQSPPLRGGAVQRIVPSEGDIVAQLSFGFWRYLLASRYTHTLWLDALRHAFPELTPQTLAHVEGPVKRLHLLRNRVAHLEPVYSNNIALDMQNMTTLLGYLCPRTQAWFGSTRVPRLKAAIASRPKIGP
ncbi:hypothetical protein OG810_14235 [Streptomyces sp. NBC_01693]|uniref:hypothetical protein n=1 Tax=Streptomyces sp. NBC_01693 TaxID=2975912 RepID=UPI002E37084D|nr:hypothetical protein [Streptomyces sp. NBC_01693]